MANVNSISSNSYSSTSSLYGNRNVLSGLASGMDTETMIQNSVSGYQTKITQLQQSQTKVEWKQDSYRALIDQMNNITQKYTSFTSKTNLSSNSFFNSSMTTTANGANASAVSATGSAKSDIQINAVKQLATSARYSVDAAALDVNAVSEAAGKAIDWSGDEAVGQISGTMTLKVGSTSIDLKFTEDDKYADMDELVAGINKKLEEASVTRKGETMRASSLISVELDGNTVKFTGKNSGGDSAYINSISGNLATMLGASKPASMLIEDKIKNNSFTVSDPGALARQQTTAEYLSGKLVDITLNGVNKQVKIGDLTQIQLPDTSGIDAEIAEVQKQIDEFKSGEDESIDDMMFRRDALYQQRDALNDRKNAALGSVMNDALVKDLQASIDKQFGKNRVTVSLSGEGGLRFDVAENSGSTIKVSSAAGEKLGVGKAGVSNYFNTSSTLGSLLSSEDLAAARMKAADGPIGTDAQYYDSDGNKLKLENGTYYRVDSRGKIMTKDGENVVATGHVNTLYTDSEGNLVKKYDNWDTYYRVNEKGEALYGLEINGTTIGGFTEDTALESVLSKINSNVDVGVNVSYSNLTSQFVFTARDTGAGGKIEFDSPLAKKLFYADNAPESVTAEKLLGDFANWDENGKMNLSITGPGIGSVKLGEISKTTTVEEIIDRIGNAKPAFKDLISFNRETGSYEFKKPGESEAADGDYANSFSFFDGKTFASTKVSSLLSAVKGGVVAAGQDAEIEATVNGKQISLTRSSNVVAMDGLSVTLKEAFTAEKASDAITFTTKSDADKVVETIRAFVEDVNKLMNDVHSAYTTQPLTKSSSSRSGYDPLTEDDKKDMSDSAIAAYEEKAKTGLLFGDTDLSQLYNRLLSSVQAYGSDRVDMESIGLSTTYSNGVTTFALDENKLRAALDSNPDKVRNVFTKTKEGGSASDGLMASLKSTLNAYGSTSIGSPGVLVRKAGTKLSAISLLNNSLQSQIDNFTKQIESWQTKLSDKIDYYTKQFTQLEKLMSTMNNQSSMLSDLMGY